MSDPRKLPVPSLGPARFRSPLRLSSVAGAGLGRFVPDDTWVRRSVDEPPREAENELLEKAGPREMLFFDPGAARAAVVTCGGLCPGLNNVLRALFLELHFNYHVPEVLGIHDGYLGLNREDGRPPLVLTLDAVEGIHRDGGTLLGTSRGPQEVSTMADTLLEWGVSMLFTVGGDGTQRGALALAQELARRNAPVAVVGIPKTIDNDVAYCQRTFGFRTAVEAAQNVLHAAHNEARGTPRGIGLVKLMGRHAGFIAATATLAAGDVNFCLVPEVPFTLDGLFKALSERMDDRGHSVIVVAEGAGQDLLRAAADGDPAEKSRRATDASGNARLRDIGPFLKTALSERFAALGKPVEIKYIDPSYVLRGGPANCEDGLLCDRLARNAVHAALAGRTEMMVGYLNGTFVHVPIERAVSGRRRLDPEGEAWVSVLAATGQPPRMV